jgi:hypothetical protein
VKLVSSYFKCASLDSLHHSLAEETGTDTAFHSALFP